MKMRGWVQHAYRFVVRRSISTLRLSRRTAEPLWASKHQMLLRSDTGNVDTAAKVAPSLPSARTQGVTSVAFDRSGYKYHGRVKALADAAREGGLEF